MCGEDYGVGLNYKSNSRFRFLAEVSVKCIQGFKAISVVYKRVSLREWKSVDPSRGEMFGSHLRPIQPKSGFKVWWRAMKKIQIFCLHSKLQRANLARSACSLFQLLLSWSPRCSRQGEIWRTVWSSEREWIDSFLSNGSPWFDQEAFLCSIYLFLEYSLGTIARLVGRVQPSWWLVQSYLPRSISWNFLPGVKLLCSLVQRCICAERIFSIVGRMWTAQMSNLNERRECSGQWRSRNCVKWRRRKFLWKSICEFWKKTTK